MTQNYINMLRTVTDDFAAGMCNRGNWNADTNTPFLANNCNFGEDGCVYTVISESAYNGERIVMMLGEWVWLGYPKMSAPFPPPPVFDFDRRLIEMENRIKARVSDACGLLENIC
jgi:hypothetical protein